MSPMIELRGVSKTVQSGDRALTILHPLDLLVPAGQSLSIVGPSGSGKSTLLGLIAGLDTPSTGQVLIGGTEITALDEDALARLRGARIGFVFQFFHLIPSLTALENVMVPLEIAGVASPSARARRLLADVGLTDRGHHYPSQLSGGEQQRVAIARALANDPPLLLADEPTGNLDSTNGRHVIDLLVDHQPDAGHDADARDPRCGAVRLHGRNARDARRPHGARRASRHRAGAGRCSGGLTVPPGHDLHPAHGVPGAASVVAPADLLLLLRGHRRRGHRRAALAGAERPHGAGGGSAQPDGGRRLCPDGPAVVRRRAQPDRGAGGGDARGRVDRDRRYRHDGAPAGRRGDPDEGGRTAGRRAGVPFYGRFALESGAAYSPALLRDGGALVGGSCCRSSVSRSATRS